MMFLEGICGMDTTSLLIIEVMVQRRKKSIEDAIGRCIAENVGVGPECTATAFFSGGENDPWHPGCDYYAANGTVKCNWYTGIEDGAGTIASAIKEWAPESHFSIEAECVGDEEDCGKETWTDLDTIPLSDTSSERRRAALRAEAASEANAAAEKAYPIGEELEPGQTIAFGRYPDTEFGASPITWVVASVEGTRALCISKFIVDWRRYSDVPGDESEANWAACSLRDWLNGEFLRDAFTDGERARIETTEVLTEDPIAEETFSSDDCIFCLSSDEVEEYEDVIGLRSPLSPNALKKCSKFDLLCMGFGKWWLRTQDCGYESATIVDPGMLDDFDPEWCNEDEAVIVNGKRCYEVRHASIDTFGCDVEEPCGVRPALWVKLDA